MSNEEVHGDIEESPRNRPTWEGLVRQTLRNLVKDRPHPSPAIIIVFPNPTPVSLSDPHVKQPKFPLQLAWS